jgi:hypothetical protein
MGPLTCKLWASYMADALITSNGAENKALREAINFVVGLEQGPTRGLIITATESLRAALGAAKIDPKNPYPGDEERTAGWILGEKDKK